jgi:hypothetical protein
MSSAVAPSKISVGAHGTSATDVYTQEHFVFKYKKPATHENVFDVAKECFSRQQWKDVINWLSLYVALPNATSHGPSHPLSGCHLAGHAHALWAAQCANPREQTVQIAAAVAAFWRCVDGGLDEDWQNVIELMCYADDLLGEYVAADRVRGASLISVPP